MGKPWILICVIIAFMVLFVCGLGGFFTWYDKHNELGINSKYGDRCDHTNKLSCSSSHLVCSESSTCTCASNYVMDYSDRKNVLCVQKRTYGEECPSGPFKPCSDINTDCIRDVKGTYRCICVNGFYRSSNVNCSSVNDLAVVEVSATSTTSKVILTWTADKHGLSAGYSVTSDQGEGQLEGSVTDTGAVWGNLTAGEKYSFKITTTIPADSTYGVKLVVVNKGDVWTEAEKPGTVVLVTCLSGSLGKEWLYKVTFQPSPGQVASYSLVINGEQASGTSSMYTFRTLYPGQNCRYAITAYNGIQNPSEVSVGSFRLNKTSPGEVRSLTATEDDDNALVLTFLCPDPRDVPDNVKGYRIQKILLNSTGLPEINASYELAASTTSCTNTFNDAALGGVLAEKTYKFTVRAFNDDFVGNYSPEITFYVSPRVPKLFLDYSGFKLLQKVDNSGLINTEFQVRVCSHCLLDSTRGTVLDVGLVVCVQGDGNSCTFTGVKHLNKFSSWDDARRSDFVVPYLTTPPDWLTSVKAQPSGLSYIIGQNSSCRSFPNTSHFISSYCNGPLPTGKQITVIVVQCNAVGCGQVEYENIFSTKELTSDINILTLGIGVVFVALLGISACWAWKLLPYIRAWVFSVSHKLSVANSLSQAAPEKVFKIDNTTHILEAPNHNKNENSYLVSIIPSEEDVIHLSA